MSHREPQPLVRWVHSRTVAKVDSIRLVVRKCANVGRKVVKVTQDFFIFLQAFAGFWDFDLVTGDKLIIGCHSWRVGAGIWHALGLAGSVTLPCPGVRLLSYAILSRSCCKH